MDKSNRRAFTLIELMVVCSILLASVGFGITRYNDTIQKRRLNQEVRKLSDVMSLASTSATAGDSGTACADFNGYQVALTTTGSYTLRLCCEAACNSAQSLVTATYQLPTGITVSAPASDTTFLFNKLNQSITIAPAANQTVTLRNTVLARCVSVTVATAGQITQSAEFSC
ncbi:prepilin-type N-terminal cleavage/methylation domain-containing protein [Candidatus Microgenomates bacterium]|nr:prepilin-type N-terminal cleavage/methylation domain-containing protein [Candidatus Microgenomates bacterium]